MNKFALVSLVFALSSCNSMGVKTKDRNDSRKVVSQDISQGAGSVDEAEVTNDQMNPPEMKVIQNKAGGGGVLIAYRIKGNRDMVPSNGCRLKLQNVSASKTVFVNIKADQASVYKELP